MTARCALTPISPLLARFDRWRLVLNRNQNLLGKCFLVSHRHTEAVTDLTQAERADLRICLIRATTAQCSSGLSSCSFQAVALASSGRLLTPGSRPAAPSMASLMMSACQVCRPVTRIRCTSTAGSVGRLRSRARLAFGAAAADPLA